MRTSPSLRVAPQLVIATLSSLLAQASAIGAAPSAGLVNDALRDWSSATIPWDLGGQFRARFESKQDAGSFPNRDFLDGLENSNDYLLFRTKVHLGYTPAPWLHVFLEGRDSHSLGDARSTSETDVFDLHQAYLRIGDLKSFPLQAEVGRLELLYGDERFIGISDWSNTGRSFDAARLRYQRGDVRIDAFSGRQVLPRNGHFNRVNDYDWISGIYATSRVWPEFQETEVFALSRQVADGSPTALTPTLGGPTPRDVLTLGTRWKSLPGKLGAWDYTVESVLQVGSVQSGPRRVDLLAAAFNLNFGHTWADAPATPRLGMGYDFGSGDDDPTDDTSHTVELLYGTNHKLYGLADVFGMRNLHIPRVNATIKPAQDLTVTAEWLGYWRVENADFVYPESAAPRSQNGYARNPGFDTFVAHEVDLLVNWKPIRSLSLQAAYAHVFTGSHLDQVGAVTGRRTVDADWFSVQAVFTF